MIKVNNYLLLAIVTVFSGFAGFSVGAYSNSGTINKVSRLYTQAEVENRDLSVKYKQAAVDYRDLSAKYTGLSRRYFDAVSLATKFKEQKEQSDQNAEQALALINTYQENTNKYKEAYEQSRVNLVQVTGVANKAIKTLGIYDQAIDNSNALTKELVGQLTFFQQQTRFWKALAEKNSGQNTSLTTPSALTPLVPRTSNFSSFEDSFFLPPANQFLNGISFQPNL